MSLSRNARRVCREPGRNSNHVKLFVSEYVCSGAWPEQEISGSLAIEGRAMLEAILEDFAGIPGVEVFATWDRRLGPPRVEGVKTILIASPEEECERFEQLARACVASFIIAPESHGILARRTSAVIRSRGRVLGPATSAISICADKSELFLHFRRQAIPTIETRPFWFEMSRADDFEYPIVVKPTDGAGSQDMVLVKDRSDFDRLRDTRRQASPFQDIWQPFIPGIAASVAMIISADGKTAEVFPPAEQWLSDDGRFHYLGGRIPARCRNLLAIRETALAACRTVPGLRGYVGVDLIVPNAGPDHPLVVEINPRLTTSYLGYRALTDDNLAERLLFPDRFSGSIEWCRECVEFDAGGCVRLVTPSAR